jgi:hypothetical protein
VVHPVNAATGSPPDSGPQIGWIQSFELVGVGGVHSIAATGDGGTVVTGYVASSVGLPGLLVMKTDNTGKKIWDYTDPGNFYEGYSVIETPDKGIVLVGSSSNPVAHGILLLKLDPSGNEKWIKVLQNGDECRVNSVNATRDGGFIIAGSVYRNDTSPSTLWDGCIIKTNADGIEQWTRFFNGERNDSANSVRQTEDGGYIIAGTTGSTGYGGVNAYLLKMNGFGDEEWFTSYGNGLENDKMSVIQTADGGYAFTGINISGETNDYGKDLFLIRTNDLGKEQWEKTVYRAGKNIGHLLIRTSGGIALMAGSSPGSEPEKNGNVTVIELDLDGKEIRNQTINLGQSIEVQDIAFVPDEGLFVTGILTDPVTLQKRIAIAKIIYNPSQIETFQKNQFNLTVIARDANNGKIIGGALTYLDGDSVGSTSEQDGKLILQGVVRGSHSVRVAKTGFQEHTRSVDLSENLQVSVSLNHSRVIPLQIHGSTEEKIDIIFVASNTSYDCNAKSKITDEAYSHDKQKFIDDVNNKINNTYSDLGTVTSPFVGLPDDYRQRFNFYYYWDEENFGDAFEGCAGKLPDTFWDNAPFADVAVILYPTYKGLYTGSPCEPIGCANGLGAGSGSWMKAPADSSMIFLHESGHVVFGLIDTYCGETYYEENSPFPNVWDSADACIKNAEDQHWDSSNCRQILKPASSRSKDICVKNFWRVDADPDIMGGGAYSGSFGNASTSRIRYILDTINRGGK